MAATAYLISPTTPPDYHRIISPTLQVPSDPNVSVPVGLLACQRDPLLRILDTTVVSVSVAQPLAAPAQAKKGKKAVLAPEIPNEPLLHVLLHDTVIFPEGGGQPTDTGRITTEVDGAVWDVVQAKRHGGHAVHYVKIREGVSVDTALLAFQAGAKVTVALGDEGYERRYDHEEVASIQAEANKLVFEGRRVHVEVEELDPVQEQARPSKLESGRSVGKALPEDYTGGVKRVVVIDGVDRNPCCGTHLPSIHNLQLFLFPHTEALSRSSTTSARLYFLSGPRLIAHLTSTHAHLASTAAILSCGPPLVPDRVTQVVEERKKAEKRVADIEQELAEHIAKGLVRRSPALKHHIHRTDDTGNALGFLNAIAFSLAAILPSAASASRPYVIVLSSAPSTQTANSTSTVLVLGSEDSKVKTVGDALKMKLSIKGGGKGPRWSGKYIGVWKEKRENTGVEEILSTL
ncbi:ThrRS/AlaRS common domain-containing protein [Pholiota molesta]|nr:ThrRS/AlaRS common domain-containing protein [Pholiota molesta]